jgi:hypothetical protein
LISPWLDRHLSFPQECVAPDLARRLEA